MSSPVIGKLEELAIRLHRVQAHAPPAAIKFHQLRDDLARRIVAAIQSPQWKQVLQGRRALEDLEAETEKMEALVLALRTVLDLASQLRGRAQHLDESLFALQEPGSAPVRGRLAATSTVLGRVAAECGAMPEVESARKRLALLETELGLDERAVPLLVRFRGLHQRHQRDRDLAFAALGADFDRIHQEFAAGNFSAEWVDALEKTVQEYEQRSAARGRTRAATPSKGGPGGRKTIIDEPREGQAAAAVPAGEQEKRGAAARADPTPPPFAPRYTHGQVELILTECRDWARWLKAGDRVKPLTVRFNEIEEGSRPEDLDALGNQAVELRDQLHREASGQCASRIETLGLRARLLAQACGEHAEIQRLLQEARGHTIDSPETAESFQEAAENAAHMLGAIANNESGKLHEALHIQAQELAARVAEARTKRRTWDADARLSALSGRIPAVDKHPPEAGKSLDGLAQCASIAAALDAIAAECAGEDAELENRRSALEARAVLVKRLAVVADPVSAEALDAARTALEAPMMRAVLILNEYKERLDALEASITRAEAGSRAKAAAIIHAVDKYLETARDEMLRGGRELAAHLAVPNPLPDDPAALAELTPEALGWRAEAEEAVTLACAALRRSIEEWNRRLAALANEGLPGFDGDYAAQLISERDALPPAATPEPVESLRALQTWAGQCESLVASARRSEELAGRAAGLRKREQALRHQHRDPYHPRLLDRLSRLLAGLDPLPPEMGVAKGQIEAAQSLLEAIEEDFRRRAALEVEQARTAIEREIPRSKDAVWVARAKALLTDLTRCSGFPDLPLRRQLALMSGISLGTGRGGER